MSDIASGKPAPSLFHRAARLAVFAIFFALVVKFVSAQTPAPAGTWLSWTAECTVFVAIPAGLVALAGIPKHGRRELLWKGLVGVFVPIILFLIGMVVATRLRESARQLIQQSSSK
jgi:uncharacterized membrane protein